MAERSRSVFINCPFDPEFEVLFHAIVFSVVAQGFEPRSALESEGHASSRIERIVRTISDCAYSIHDLSRYRGEGVDNFARFNMPLELGIAIGIGAAGNSPHSWVILFEGRYEYQKFLSDLAGMDPFRHESTPQSVVSAVSAWLRLQSDSAETGPSARAVLDAFPLFRERLKLLKTDSLERVIWPDLVDAAVRTAPSP